MDQCERCRRVRLVSSQLALKVLLPSLLALARGDDGRRSLAASANAGYDKRHGRSSS